MINLMMFQSTRPRGARRFQSILQYLIGMFQSTRPRGARLWAIARKRYKLLFQSTRPRGARPAARWLIAHDITVSIHAPAWGATHR